jgi:hypothetical protein
MRPFYLGIIVAALTVSSATAQTRAKDKSVPLPQINVPSDSGSAGVGGCGNIQAGSPQSFDCLNRQLEQKVNGVNPGTPTAPLNASSTDIKVGTVNMSAVKQQYGKNFGVSAIPYRPALTYGASPIRAR